MHKILIAYDLISPGRDYQPVYDYLQGFGTRVKPLRSTYIIYTNKSTKEIRDEIKTLIDANDKVLVFNVTGANWATYNLPNTAEWLNEHA